MCHLYNVLLALCITSMVSQYYCELLAWCVTSMVCQYYGENTSMVCHLHNVSLAWCVTSMIFQCILTQHFAAWIKEPGLKAQTWTAPGAVEQNWVYSIFFLDFSVNIKIFVCIEINCLSQQIIPCPNYILRSTRIAFGRLVSYLFVFTHYEVNNLLAVQAMVSKSNLSWIEKIQKSKAKIS